MTTTKLRIDLKQGVLEVEGTDQFVREIYSDFKDRINSSSQHQSHTKPSTEGKSTVKQSNTGEPSAKKSAGKKRNSTSGTQPTIVKDLDLSGNDKGIERLKGFYASFKISSNLERNLVFLYYLQQKLEVSPLKPDHVFTCYRDVGVKVPTALVQSLRDTASRRGWIDTNNTNDLKVTTFGINYLEHDLKKVSAES